MSEFELSTLQKIAVWLLPVLFAITVHETAHGWMALKLGDRTAQMLGRLSLNPIRHIDPVGTLLVPALMLAFTGIVFGWAKPVPITWQNLHQPRRDTALVAIAGPASNLLMGLFWALVITAGALLGGMPGVYLILAGTAGIFINTILLVLNLLPLPPLDGSRVVGALLPGKLAWHYSRIEPYGFIILALLLVTGLLGEILWPLIGQVLALLGGIAGLAGNELSALLSLLLPRQ